MRPRVFVTQPVAASALERLGAVAEVELNRDPLHILSKDELCAAVRDRDVLFSLLHDRVDGDVMAQVFRGFGQEVPYSVCGRDSRVS